MVQKFSLHPRHTVTTADPFVTLIPKVPLSLHLKSGVTPGPMDLQGVRSLEPQPLGSANVELTPAGAPAAAAGRKQRPDATCEEKNG